MPHEKEKKRERGMQFRVALRMLILPVFDCYTYTNFRELVARSLRRCKRNFVDAKLTYHNGG